MLKTRAGLGCQLAHAAGMGAAELEKRRGQVLLELFLQKRMYYSFIRALDLFRHGLEPAHVAVVANHSLDGQEKLHA